jgi:hypothetical protein
MIATHVFPQMYTIIRIIRYVDKYGNINQVIFFNDYFMKIVLLVGVNVQLLSK